MPFSPKPQRFSSDMYIKTEPGVLFCFAREGIRKCLLTTVLLFWPAFIASIFTTTVLCNIDMSATHLRSYAKTRIMRRRSRQHTYLCGSFRAKIPRATWNDRVYAVYKSGGVHVSSVKGAGSSLRRDGTHLISSPTPCYTGFLSPKDRRVVVRFLRGLGVVTLGPRSCLGDRRPPAARQGKGRVRRGMWGT